jgi:hypothetical protein
VIPQNAPLTLRASYLPLPPPQLHPLFSESSLIAVLVNPAHGTQGCFKTTSFDKNYCHLNFQLTFSNLLFPYCSIPVHFCNTICRKNAPPFSANQQSKNPFPAFFFVMNFYSSLINMPFIHIKEFETSLLTLFGVSLVLWRRKADNALSNPCFMALSPNFTTSVFPISNYFTFKNFC